MRQQRNVTEMERESERQPESEQRASVVCTSNPSVVCKERERKREKGKEEGKEEEEEEGRRDTVQRKQRSEQDRTHHGSRERHVGQKGRD